MSQEPYGGEKRGNISRSGGLQRGKGDLNYPHTPPKISHPGRAALLGSSAPELRCIGVLPGNHGVVSALGGEGLGMGASHTTHSLPLGNTPGPQVPSCELDATTPPGPGQTHRWLRRCSARPQHPPLHANSSAHPPRAQHITPSPGTTYSVHGKAHGGCDPEPPCSKNPPFPKRTTGWEQGRGWETQSQPSRVVRARTIPFTFTAVFPTPGTRIGAALPQHSPTGPGPAEIRAPRAAALGLGAGKRTQPKAAAQPLLSIRANEHEGIC